MIDEDTESQKLYLVHPNDFPWLKESHIVFTLTELFLSLQTSYRNFNLMEKISFDTHKRLKLAVWVK